MIAKNNEETEFINQWQSKLEMSNDKLQQIIDINMDDFEWDFADENGKIEFKNYLDKRGIDILKPRENYKFMQQKAGAEPEELYIGPEISTDVGEKFEEVVDKKKGAKGAKKK